MLRFFSSSACSGSGPHLAVVVLAAVSVRRLLSQSQSYFRADGHLCSQEADRVVPAAYQVVRAACHPWIAATVGCSGAYSRDLIRALNHLRGRPFLGAVVVAAAFLLPYPVQGSSEVVVHLLHRLRLRRLALRALRARALSLLLLLHLSGGMRAVLE